MEETMSRGLKWYYERKKNHLCVLCGEVPPEPGRVMCQACSAHHQAYRKARKEQRIQEDRCTRCGAPMPRDDWHKMCAKCRRDESAKSRARQDMWRSQGRCARCGKPLEGPKKNCDACLQKLRERRERKEEQP